MKESVLRTLVPIIYALLIKAGFASLGVDDVTLQALAALIVTGILYVGLRIGERYKSQIGWLLGYAAQPTYATPPPAPVVPPAG